MNGRWFIVPRPNGHARVRLYCFPFAGGNSTIYRTWPERLWPDVEVVLVELPGRGGRLREPPFRSAPPLVRALGEAFREEARGHFALFGHSMGAVVAFELARELHRRGAPSPVLLAVSGHQGPRRPDVEPPFSHLPDADFLAEVRRRYDGIPPEILAEEELLQLLLPVLRADIQVLEAYAYAAEPPLDCPLSCFGGEDDTHVSLDDLEAWQEESRSSSSIHRMLSSGVL